MTRNDPKAMSNPPRSFRFLRSFRFSRKSEKPQSSSSFYEKNIDALDTTTIDGPHDTKRAQDVTAPSDLTDDEQTLEQAQPEVFPDQRLFHAQPEIPKLAKDNEVRVEANDSGDASSTRSGLTAFTVSSGSSRSLAKYKSSTMKRGQILRMLGKHDAFYWDSPKVSSWLRLCGLEQYVDTFVDNGVNGQVLLELQREQLVRGLGISHEAHLMSIERGILELRRKHIDYENWEWTATGVQEWLKERSFDKLIDTFRDAAVHGGVLFTLSPQEIAELVSDAYGSPAPSGPTTQRSNHDLIVESLVLCIDRARSAGKDSKSGILDWGSFEVQGWLTEQHLGHLDGSFRKHCVSGPLLLQLTREDMEQVMRLTEIQALVLVKALRKLRKRHARSTGVRGRLSRVVKQQSLKSQSSGNMHFDPDDDQ